jgi:hypothetical protein
MPETALFRISGNDNAAVALRPLKKGEILSACGKDITVKEDVPVNFKVAVCDIKKGDKVIKYGCQIRSCTGYTKGRLLFKAYLKRYCRAPKRIQMSIKPQTNTTGQSDKSC